jgi:TPR repeat protein
MTDLGYIAETGGMIGRPNIEYAKKFYEQAIEKENPRAMSNLAMMYLQNHIPENF